jgi:hypothetical protein
MYDALQLELAGNSHLLFPSSPIPSVFIT